MSSDLPIRFMAYPPGKSIAGYCENAATTMPAAIVGASGNVTFGVYAAVDSRRINSNLAALFSTAEGPGRRYSAGVL
jgi:hypothetical protein